MKTIESPGQRRLRRVACCAAAAVLLLVAGSADARPGRHHHHHGARVVVVPGFHYHQPYGQRTVVVQQPVAVQPAPSTAQLFVYPQRGQTAAQQSRDEYECHRWAVGQTGYDPVRGGGQVATVHGARRADGLPDDPVTGAVGGAALGAAGGAIAGDAATGAAVGAGIGALAGILGQSNASTTAVVTGPARDPGTYVRAFSTCLAGRGYVVG